MTTCIADFCGSFRSTAYVEFGANQIGRVDVDFFGGPKPTGTFHEPSELGAKRRARWFGRV